MESSHVLEGLGVMVERHSTTGGVEGRMGVNYSLGTEADKSVSSCFMCSGNVSGLPPVHRDVHRDFRKSWPTNSPEISENLGLTPPPTTASRLDLCSMEHWATLPTCSWSIHTNVTSIKESPNKPQSNQQTLCWLEAALGLKLQIVIGSYQHFTFCCLETNI